MIHDIQPEFPLISSNDYNLMPQSLYEQKKEATVNFDSHHFVNFDFWPPCVQNKENYNL